MGLQTLFTESQTLTRAAPTLSTEGQEIKGFSSLTVVVEAESGQTITGGTLKAYCYDPDLAFWFPIPAMDRTLTSVSSRRYGFAALDVVGPRNSRVLFAASAVTVSGGTTVTVYQLGFKPKVADIY